MCPYTCVIEDCPTPHVFFSTRKDWENHVRYDHPPRWQCPLCDGEDIVFRTLGDVMDHFHKEHIEAVSDDFLPTLLSWSAIQCTEIRSCPLCESSGPQDSPDLVDHVLEHIHDFSLRALPWPKHIAPNLEKPVGTYSLEIRDADGLIQWLDEMAPGNSAQLQLSAFDMTQHSEPDSGNPSGGFDYFAENDYFADDPKDDSSKPQTNHSITSNQLSETLHTADSPPPDLSEQQVSENVQY
jgi:hypothetical protein